MSFSPLCIFKCSEESRYPHSRDRLTIFRLQILEYSLYQFALKHHALIAGATKTVSDDNSDEHMFDLSH